MKSKSKSRHCHRTKRPQTSAEYLRYVHANPKAAGVRNVLLAVLAKAQAKVPHRL